MSAESGRGFFDDFFAEAWAAGLTQTVVLATGLDPDLFRLAWPPEIVVFEVGRGRLELERAAVDEPGALARAVHHVVAADLSDDWVGALRGAGFEARLPTVWLVETARDPRPAAAAREFLGAVDELSAPGSRLALRDNTAPGRGDDGDVAATLRTLSWTVLEASTVGPSRYVTAERIGALDQANPGQRAVWRLAATAYRSFVGWTGGPF
jgi:methyltransferase (TIGR00027 family)